MGLLTPDLVLFLDLSIEKAIERGGFGLERYETRELQVKVREQFMKIKDPSWQASQTDYEASGNEVEVKSGTTY